MPWVLPIIHPASIVRGRWHEEPAQIVYLKRLASILRGENTPPVDDVDSPPPNTLLWPSLTTLKEFNDELTQEIDELYGLYWNTLSVDIESAGPFVTLIGITALSTTRGEVGPTLSLPFRIQHGQNYWPTWEDHLSATTYLYSWLANPELDKVFHNGITYDVPILEEHGFIVLGELWDTMVMQHYMYPEMRKGLQYCATLYTGALYWKGMLDPDKDEAEGKG